MEPFGSLREFNQVRLGLPTTGLSHLLLVRGNGNRSEYRDDGHNHHQLDQSEA